MFNFYSSFKSASFRCGICYDDKIAQNLYDQATLFASVFEDHFNQRSMTPSISEPLQYIPSSLIISMYQNFEMKMCATRYMHGSNR